LPSLREGALRFSQQGRAVELAALTSFAALEQTPASQITKRAARAGPAAAMLGCAYGPAGGHPASAPSRRWLASGRRALDFAAGGTRRRQPMGRRAAQGQGRRAYLARFVD